MNYKYKNVSAGYANQAYENATLNSRYYHLFFEALKQSPDMIHNTLTFPQRIPRNGFFIELYDLETQEYRNDYDLLIHQITDNYIKSLKKLMQSHSEMTARQYINWSNIMLRYGRFEELVNHFPHNYMGHYQLEIELIKETAKIEIILSNNGVVTIGGLLELAARSYDKKSTSLIEKIKLLNQIIVSYYRYQNDVENRQKIYNLSNKLLEHIENIEGQIFINEYLSSIAYRGLAMVSDYSDELKSEFLNKSLMLAKNIQSTTELEKTVALDNLFTCTQSHAKWNLKNNDLLNAEAHLLELTQIDHYDSTGFSEVGLFYFHKESYELAAKYFNSAMKLGSPGTGMNTYYYAICLGKIGDDENAIKNLYYATELDKAAVSPWLDLMDIYLKNKANDKAHEIAMHIYNKQDLMEQLEADEISSIQNIIKENSIPIF